VRNERSVQLARFGGRVGASPTVRQGSHHEAFRTGWTRCCSQRG
jgi:hypothetical protein